MYVVSIWICIYKSYKNFICRLNMNDICIPAWFPDVRWCTTHQIFACMCLRLNQRSSCFLNKFLQLIIYFLKKRLRWDGTFCTRRCRIQVPSHGSLPLLWLFHFYLNVNVDTSLKVRPFFCCFMDGKNANTLFLIRPTKRIHGPCVPAPFVLGGYANSRLGALGQNTCLCRKVTTTICAFPSLYPSLGTWSPSCLLLSQYRCLKQCKICTLDTSAWNLAEFWTCFLRESDLLQHYNCCFF